MCNALKRVNELGIKSIIKSIIVYRTYYELIVI
jgi:hypothetical protein